MRLYDDHGESILIYDRSIITLDWVHYQVHIGMMYTTEHTASVANTNSLDLLITIGDNEFHATFAIQGGGQMTAYLYESPNASGGTPLTLYNMNRDSSNTSTVTVAHTPTVVSTGTTAIINGRLIPGGTSAPTRLGGAARENTEWILKPGLKYLLRLTNTSGGTITENAVLQGYEE